MASEWQSIPLEEIASPDVRPFAMGPFGSNIRSENYRPEGVPVIRGTNLSEVGGPRFKSDEFVYLSEEKANELSSASAVAGDIVFVAQGTVGKVGIVPPSDSFSRYVLSQNLMRVRLDNAKADSLYVYYFFQSAEGQQEILSRVNPTGVPCISQPLTSLRTFKVQLPSQTEQRGIAHILGTLDDKIELNRKMNETLEAMARALFKSWFVDFDPVRAKTEGRAPGLPAPIAALFPDSFDDSELGEVPKGWRVGKFGDVAANPRRSIRPDQIAEGTPYIALEHMPRKSIALSDWGVADRVESGKLLFQAGEILFGKLRPYFHKVGIAPIDGVCSTDILVIAPSAPEWFGFVLEHASSAELVEHTNGASTGTKMPRTNWNELARFPLVLPPQEIARAFNDYIQLIRARIIGAAHENRTLVASRDAILPKLISGEIRLVSHGEVVI